MSIISKFHKIAGPNSSTPDLAVPDLEFPDYNV